MEEMRWEWKKKETIPRNGNQCREKNQTGTRKQLDTKCRFQRSARNSNWGMEKKIVKLWIFLLCFCFFRIVVVWLRIHRVRDRWVGPIAEREDREDRREVLRGAHRAGLHADRAVVPCEVRRAEDHAAEVPPYVPPFGC